MLASPLGLNSVVHNLPMWDMSQMVDRLSQMVDRATDIVLGNEAVQTSGDGGQKPPRYEVWNENENDKNKKKKKKQESYKPVSEEERKVFQFGVKKLLTLSGQWTFGKYREYHKVCTVIV